MKIDDLKGVTDINRVIKNAIKYFNDPNIKIYVSTHKYKKFMIQRPDGKFVHFGDNRFIDYTKHLDEQKRTSYLNRAVNIRGFWRDDKYSPNNLAINLLWQ